jgi:excisionase family DNA binding protein
MNHPHSPSLRNYLTVAQAAAVLGVAANTVRAWGAAGKIPSTRNPANGYRLYRREDLEAFLDHVATSVGEPAGSRNAK